MAMGYEIAVTPLQLVAAYSALANGGVLMEPHLVKEVRSAEGEVLYEAKPRMVRQVFSPEISNTVRNLLISVVDSGTGRRADLATFRLAGKSGTARRTAKGQGYVAGNYTASFVGLFPADDPQFVVLVKLDSPRGAYYGGEIAAPVSAVVLRAAIAAQNAGLNRSELAVVEKRVALPESSNLAQRSTAGPTEKKATDVMFGPDDEIVRDQEPVSDTLDGTAGPVRPTATFNLPFARPKLAAQTTPRPVPDVTGMTLRSAVHALHSAGFRVQLVQSSGALTLPAPGTLLVPGSVVKLQHIP
jgi:membrane peptidoglycan carboxypeptidase